MTSYTEPKNMGLELLAVFFVIFFECVHCAICMSAMIGQKTIFCSNVDKHDTQYRAEKTMGLELLAVFFVIFIECVHCACCFTCLGTEILIRNISFLPVHISKTVTNCCFLVWFQITPSNAN